MDYLLRYALFKVAVMILLFELAVLILCTVAIIAIKWWFKRKKRKDEATQDELTNYITQSYFSGSYQKIPSQLNQIGPIVEALEKFDQRVQDEKWEKVKLEIIEKTCLSKAKSYVNSFFWKERQLAARVFFLAPKFATNQELLTLLKDSKYLVRVVAASTITRMDSKELLFEMVRQMAKEPSLSRFAYRDALLQMNDVKFGWLQELVVQDKDPNVQSICLDVFGQRSTKDLTSVLINFIYGQNSDHKLFAIKALKSTPGRAANDVLIHCLNDKDWKIRAEALQSLNAQSANALIDQIRELLKDPEWFVRLQAALVLKNLGEPGIKTLSLQTPHSNQLAHEISQYVLSL
jgi:HEAT repeat protein